MSLANGGLKTRDKVGIEIVKAAGGLGTQQRHKPLFHVAGYTVDVLVL
jgi:hypothetical protein